MFYIILIIYIIFVIYHCILLKKYNRYGRILYIKDINEVDKHLISLNPIVSSYITSLSFADLLTINPTYIIKDDKRLLSLKSFKDEKQLYLYKNKDIIHDLHLKPEILSYLFKNLYYLKNNTLSLYKGNIITNTIKCINNYKTIHILHGETTFYLFNPKHEKEIKDKSLHEIKKWSHKIQLKKHSFIIIPPQWHYIQISEKETIQYDIDINTYFTFFIKYFY